MVEVVAIETVPVLTDAEFLRDLAERLANTGAYLLHVDVDDQQRLAAIATLLEAVGT